MNILILGCGYVGIPLGQLLLRQGHTVFGLRRSHEGVEQLAQAGITPIQGDLSEPSCIELLPSSVDVVVNSVSSSKGGVEVYREVYLEGSRRIIAHLRSHPVARYIHIGSTSVLGQTDGSWVDEDSPATPKNPTSQVLVETERLLQSAWKDQGCPAMIVRPSGIYGPDRGFLFQQFLKGEARLTGDGTRFLNMIHLEDLVRLLVEAIHKGQPGEIYHFTDDEPVTQRAFFEWLSQTLNKPFPPSASVEETVSRKRGLTSKRISNQKIHRDFGYTFQFPTFREGFTNEMKRMNLL